MTFLLLFVIFAGISLYYHYSNKNSFVQAKFTQGHSTLLLTYNNSEKFSPKVNGRIGERLINILRQRKDLLKYLIGKEIEVEENSFSFRLHTKEISFRVLHNYPFDNLTMENKIQKILLLLDSEAIDIYKKINNYIKSDFSSLMEKFLAINSINEFLSGDLPLSNKNTVLTFEEIGDLVEIKMSDNLIIKKNPEVSFTEFLVMTSKDNVAEVNIMGNNISGNFKDGSAFSTNLPNYPDLPEISFSDFLNMIENGDVEEVKFSGNNISGNLKNGTPFFAFLPNNYPNLIDKLYESGVQIKFQPFLENQSSMKINLLIDKLYQSGVKINVKPFLQDKSTMKINLLTDQSLLDYGKLVNGKLYLVKPSSVKISELLNIEIYTSYDDKVYYVRSYKKFYYFMIFLAFVNIMFFGYLAYRQNKIF